MKNAGRSLQTNLALLLACMVPSVVHAYELEPIVVQLAPSGNGSVQSMTITNTHEVPIAIEVAVYRREQKVDGSEEREEELDDILLTPPQMVIAPGSSQTFKVRYVGPQDVQRERTYRVVTEQLPIRLKKEERGDLSAQVSMRYRYEAALYVVPPQRKPAFRLLDANPIETDGERFLELDIASEGNMRAILQSPRLTVSGGGSTATLSGEELGPLEGLNILAGNHRQIRVSWPESIPFGEVEASLDARLLILQ